MAAISCKAGGTYTCVGLAGACARAIAKLKTIDVAAGRQVTEIAELRISTVDPARGDHVRVGRRRFSVDEQDIIVSELPGDMVEVTVFEGERLIFRGTRSRGMVSYGTADGMTLPFTRVLEEEDSIQLDPREVALLSRG